MNLFHRKKKLAIVSQYRIREMVSLRYKGELIFGYVYEIKQDKDGKVIYDIQVCGQCPWFVYNVLEEELMPYMGPR